jgi:hypothetical protein
MQGAIFSRPTDVGSADIAGAKTCHATDNLEYRYPFHVT